MATVAPSRNRIVQAAFAGLEKDRRAEKKAAKVEEPVVSKTPASKQVASKKPAKARRK